MGGWPLDLFQDLPDQARRDAIARRLAPLNVGDTEAVNPDHGKVFEFKTVERATAES